MRTSTARILVFSAVCLVACCSCDPLYKKLAERHIDAGYGQYAMSNYTAAADEFSAAIWDTPTNADAYVGRAACKYALSNFVGAMGDYNTAIKLKPEATGSFLARGATKFRLHQFSAAIADLSKAVELEPENPAGYLYRGHLREESKDHTKAIADFNKVIELNPDSALGYLSRAYVEARQKRLDEALADANKAVELDSDEYLAFLVRGSVKQTLKDYPGALVDANRAVELRPQEADAFVLRGRIKMGADDLDGADQDLQTGLRLNPSNHLGIATRGLAKKHRGDLAGALADLNMVAQFGDERPTMYELLGCIQSDLGQYPRALETYRKAVAAEPTLDYARYRIWLLRVRLGERTEATHELEAYFDTLQGSKTTNWSASIYRFLGGRISEKQFLGEAGALIERPAEKPGQICESYYYAAMKRMFDGDKAGAMELFQRCLDTKQGNYNEFGSAGVELAELKKP